MAAWNTICVLPAKVASETNKWNLSLAGKKKIQRQIKHMCGDKT